jgi:phenylacetate-CoA ligase
MEMEQVLYWRQDVETLPREKLEELQLRRFKKQMRHVYERTGFYRRKFDKARITPDDIRTLDDIQHVPFTVKEELRDSQIEHPPWGDFLCVPPEDGVRAFQTSGTTGVPVKILVSKTDWTVHFYEQFMHYMYGYGLKPSDVLFVPFHFGLHIAWWGFSTALGQEGVLIIPGGGQSSKDRVKNIFDWTATAVCGTPTYMVHLGEVAQEMGTPLTDSRVKTVVVAGEPGATVASTRRLIEKLWGARCYDDIGSTETTNFGYECIFQNGTHVIESMFYAECLDMETLKPVEEGDAGELVLSNLCTESMPLLRYRIKDLVRFNREKCECGRTFLRLDGGVLGRADDMFHFAGVNVFPSAIENLIREQEEFATEYQLVVPPMAAGGRLKIRVEPASPDVPRETLDKAAAKLIETVRYRLTVTPEVEIAEPGELPRFEGKAKRVIREG